MAWHLRRNRASRSKYLKVVRDARQPAAAAVLLSDKEDVCKRARHAGRPTGGAELPSLLLFTCKQIHSTRPPYRVRQRGLRYVHHLGVGSPGALTAPYHVCRRNISAALVKLRTLAAPVCHPVQQARQVLPLRRSPLANAVVEQRKKWKKAPASWL